MSLTNSTATRERIERIADEYSANLYAENDDPDQLNGSSTIHIGPGLKPVFIAALTALCEEMEREKCPERFEFQRNNGGNDWESIRTYRSFKDAMKEFQHLRTHPSTKNTHFRIVEVSEVRNVRAERLFLNPPTLPRGS